MKIGKTSFDTGNLAFKNRSEFMNIYKTKMTKAELEKAWTALKQYIPVKKKYE